MQNEFSFWFCKRMAFLKWLFFNPCLKWRNELSDRICTFPSKWSASWDSVQCFASMSISSLDITGSFSCSIHDHIKLQRIKGSLSVQILSQAPSWEFSSFLKQNKKKIQTNKTKLKMHYLYTFAKFSLIVAVFGSYVPTSKELPKKFVFFSRVSTLMNSNTSDSLKQKDDSSSAAENLPTLHWNT